MAGVDFIHQLPMISHLLIERATVFTLRTIRNTYKSPRIWITLQVACNAALGSARSAFTPFTAAGQAIIEYHLRLV